MRILFMGTPDIAAQSLEALYAAGHEICGVFTREDKPVGRKQVLTAPPVKQLALAHGTPVYQPRTLRDGKAAEDIRALAPELIVVVAYGRILPPEVLAIPPKGCINLHVSLLPKYRGSAPIQWAVIHGDKTTGVTIMQLDEGLDTGDILMVQPVDIGPEETSGQLFDRVAAVGAETLCRCIEEIAAGRAVPTPQDHEKATLAPPLTKEMARFAFEQPAQVIHDQVRGLLPWPVASTDLFGGDKVKIFTTIETEDKTGKEPGTILRADKAGIDVACGGGTVLRITELQAPGSRRMAAADYLRGHPITV